MGGRLRGLIAFPCEGETLIGTIDQVNGTTGLLIVSGGNEIRCGAHRGMALLAARLAAAGTPVFRFDRRGVGDSSGENGGYVSSAADLIAAAAAFRAAAPQVRRLVAFGNCDAATALALFGASAGIDALVLANPWVVERTAGDPLPPAAAIRTRYRERLRDPLFWRELISGRVNWSSAFKGLRRITGKTPQPSDLARRFATAIRGREARLVLAKGDATAIAYADAMRLEPALPTVTIDTASHSFARPGDAEALEAAIRAALSPQFTT